MKQFYPYRLNQKFTTNSNKQIYSPENSEVIGSIYQVDQEQITSFFDDAETAFKTFRHTSFPKRKQILKKWCAEIRNHFDEIVALIVQSICKTQVEAAKEVKDALDFIDDVIAFEYGHHPRFYDCQKSSISKIAYYQRIPYGVILCITPFNYPVSACMFKVAPAIITGNTVVVKAATQSSLVVSFLFKLLSKTGIMPGVASYVTCEGRAIGNKLVTQKSIKIINFTGSTLVGKQIKTLNPTAIKLLELGGNDIGIVLSDANIDNAVTQIVTGAFRYNGQRCTAIKRLIIENSIYDCVLKKLKVKVKQLTVGKAHENPDITSMISCHAIKRAVQLVKSAVAHGAKVESGFKYDGNFQSNLLTPTIVSVPEPTSDLFVEEQFAPILPIYRGQEHDYDNYIQIANNSEYGLQGSVFTQNIDRALSFANKIETGSVNINCAPAKGPNYLPFFGIKNSGSGSQGFEDILNLYTYQKGIIIKYKQDL